MYYDIIVFILFLIIFKMSLSIFVDKTPSRSSLIQSRDLLKNEYSLKVNSILPSENNTWLPSQKNLIIPVSHEYSSLFVNQPYVFYKTTQNDKKQSLSLPSVSTTPTPPPNDLLNIINNQKKTNVYEQISYKKTTLASICKSSKDCEDGLVCAGNNNTSGNLLPIDYTCKRIITTIPCNNYSCMNPLEREKNKITQNTVLNRNIIYNISELGEFCGGNTLNITGNTCNKNKNLICASDSINSTSAGICLTKVD